MERKPVTIEIGGRPFTFKYEDTEVRMYRQVASIAFNHVVTIERGVSDQRIYLFSMPRLAMYLSGIEQPNHGLDKKEREKMLHEMDEKFGWEARTIIEDEAPQDIQDRFYRIATRDLVKASGIPQEWHHGA